MGIVLHESLTQRRIKLVNSGSQEASFKVEADSVLPVKVTPAESKVAPSNNTEGSIVELRVDIAAESPGAFAGKVQIHVEGQEEPLAVDFSATVVAHTFELVDGQGALVSKLDFGALHYGDTCTQNITLINNGPRDARFFSMCASPEELAESEEHAATEDAMARFLQVTLLLPLLVPLDH